MKNLTALELAAFLKESPQWKHFENKLTRSFTFKGFGKAMDFMQAMRAPINALRHHPEWLNVYNRLDVALTTHDTGGITELDLQLARAFDDQFAKSS